MTRKVALITGASRGIGEQIAVSLAQEGYDIVINYIGDMESANRVKKSCETYGVSAVCLEADVTKKDQVKEMFNQVMEQFGRLDVLINNSGITRDNLILRMSEEDFEAVIDVNLVGTFHCIKQATRIMMKQHSGVIINMASVIGLIGNIGQANYAASKAGVIGLTKSVAKELASRNVRVNAIAPGFIQTNMTEVLDDKVKEQILKNIPLNTFGSVEDISNLVNFLVSDKAKYITGQVIHVDGGMVV